MRAAFLPLLLAASPAAADLGLTPAERAAFRAEVRALLLDEPEIVARALAPPDLFGADPYADDVAADHALILSLAAALFEAPELQPLGTGPVGMAAFLAPGDDATRAMLADLAKDTGIGIALHFLTPEDLATDPTAAALGLDLLPSFVTPGAIIRGDVPKIALARALDRD